MRITKLISYVLICFFLVGCFGSSNSGDELYQNSFSVSLETEDVDKNVIKLEFGQKEGATKGYDKSIDKDTPPSPPEGVTHTYFATIDKNLLHDYRKLGVQISDWELKYELGVGESLFLSWRILDQLGGEGELVLTDIESAFEVDMTEKSEYTVSGQSSGSLLIKYRVKEN
ncbi:hypothetical protein [Fodinibius halophilus]|uniref:Lipocalin-like domain-containing protein n=1 Tax=Fodinibius halophilus TaxID=1736908 RepID=A0A6M1T4G0_9BACT|nr:hypothetical protein [Fodinibius halophilus]NGP88937.1 hypothetical protein [Fodinibius halophilus]